MGNFRKKVRKCGFGGNLATQTGHKMLKRVQHDVLRHSGLDPESPERRAGRGRTEIP